jgi:branched-subunit amino acid ABC-type transport system permease component
VLDGALWFWIAQVLNGVAIGIILFLVAAGLTLLLGVMGMLNLAHGAFYMIGAYALYSVFATGTWGWYGLGLIAVLVATAATGAVLERFALRPLYARPPGYILLATFALVLIFDDLVILIWGRAYKSVPPPAPFDGALHLGPVPFPAYYAFVIVVGIAVTCGLWLLLQRTAFGRLVRALATDLEMVAALGVNVSRSLRMVYVLSAALAGIGGAMAAPLRSISSGMGVEVVIQSFVVVVIGGLGSIWGAFIGALILGQFSALGILLVPRFAVAIPYLVLVAVLIWRPNGLFGSRA